ncbi:MAG: choice-of-anchor J domain-containing protein [candidate division WOR-3 bacterium]
MRVLFCLVALFSAGSALAVDLSESFSGTQFPPEQWTVFNNDAGVRSWQRSTAKFRTAPACAAITSESQSLRNDDWLVTRRLFPVPGRNEVSFYARAHNAAKPESIELRVSTGDCSVEEFTHLIGGFTTSSSAYQQRTLSLAAFDSTPVYLAFRHRSLGQRVCYLDDITGPRLVPTDAGINAILSPASYLPPDTNVTPRVVVKNFGGERIGGFTVSLAIIDTATQDTAYAATTVADSLDPQATAEITFTPDWHTQLGGYLVVARAELAGDMEPRNDSLAAYCAVVIGEIHDAALSAIIRPAGIIPAGPIAPCVEVLNLGNVGELFPVIMTVLDGTNPVYSDTIAISLAAGASDTFSFADWTALPGFYTVLAWTELSTDMNPANDTTSGDVEVVASAHDVGVVAILAPTDTVNQGDPVQPQAVVGNYGAANETFDILMQIGNDYFDTITVTLAARTVDTLSFDSWLASVPGEVPVICFTALPGDEVPENDSARATVVVLPGQGQVERPVPAILRDFVMQSVSGNLLRLQFRAPAGERVELRIHDATGRIVMARTVTAGAGPTELIWDRTCRSGARAPTGVYLARLTAGNRHLDRKAVLY